MSPSEVHPVFAQAFNAWDVDAATALYEADAVMVYGPGAQARGTAAIRNAFAHYFKMRPKMEVTAGSILLMGDVALVSARWKVRGHAPDGTPIRQEGCAASVLRRQSDGSWLFAIDNPLA